MFPELKKPHDIDFVSSNTLMLILNLTLTCLQIIAPQNSVHILEILFYDQIHETESANIMIMNSPNIWTVISWAGK